MVMITLCYKKGVAHLLGSGAATAPQWVDDNGGQLHYSTSGAYLLFKGEKHEIGAYENKDSLAAPEFQKELFGLCDTLYQGTAKPDGPKTVGELIKEQMGTSTPKAPETPAPQAPVAPQTSPVNLVKYEPVKGAARPLREADKVGQRVHGTERDYHAVLVSDWVNMAVVATKVKPALRVEGPKVKELAALLGIEAKAKTGFFYLSFHDDLDTLTRMYEHMLGALMSRVSNLEAVQTLPKLDAEGNL